MLFYDEKKVDALKGNRLKLISKAGETVVLGMESAVCLKIDQSHCAVLRNRTVVH